LIALAVSWFRIYPKTAGSRFTIMLKFLSIRNFAIIDELDIDFGPGFNLITGETGSGKSILVDAVGLLAGTRAQQEMIRQGSESAVIEGIFKPDEFHSCWEMLEDAGIDISDREIIIRREISQGGNNRAYVNSRLVPLSLVLQLGVLLIDIHGQHAQQDLLTPGSHLGFLDRYAENGTLLKEYSEEHRTLQSIEMKLSQLENSERNRLQRLDLLNFQINEIEQLELDPGADGLLENEKSLLANAENLQVNSNSAYSLIYEDDISVLPLLDQALRKIEHLKKMDPSLNDLHKKMLNLRYQTEEISYSLRDYADKIEVNPQRLEIVEDRLNEIEKLKRKYGSGIDEILLYHQEICDEVKGIKESEIRDRELREDREQCFQNCLNLAQELSRTRKESSIRMISDIEKELSELAMKNVRFAVDFKNLPEPGPDGMDQLEFLISTNKGEDPRPLVKIASGGELSRIMLALRTVLKSENMNKSLVFDEVDAGIGGQTASVLGEKLSSLAEKQQVFCVTHLPQVAAFGWSHYHVGKSLYKDRTRATISLLDQQGRIEELSMMLGGDTVSDTTRKQAWEMLYKRNSHMNLPDGDSAERIT
jgi:DNA repair protein RecN (Recombination protein N)